MAKPNLTKDGSDNDFVLNGDSVWIKVKGVAVYILKTDEGVIVDLFRAGAEMEEHFSSAAVLDSEIEEAKKMEDEQGLDTV